MGEIIQHGTQIRRKYHTFSLKIHKLILILVYRSQTWILTRNQTKICQEKMEREMLGLNLQYKIRNEELRCLKMYRPMSQQSGTQKQEGKTG